MGRLGRLNHSRWGFLWLGRVALFLATIGGLSWFSVTSVGRGFFVEPMTRFSVVVSHFTINLVGGSAGRSGNLLISSGATLDIQDGCNGVEAMILYAGAVVAHQAGAGAKVLGLALGVPIIWVINLLRIMTLYAVSVIRPGSLEFFHIYFWQTLIIISVVALWYLWASWALARHLRISPPLGAGTS